MRCSVLKENPGGKYQQLNQYHLMQEIGQVIIIQRSSIAKLQFKIYIQFLAYLTIS